MSHTPLNDDIDSKNLDYSKTTPEQEKSDLGSQGVPKSVDGLQTVRFSSLKNSLDDGLGGDPPESFSTEPCGVVNGVSTVHGNNFLISPKLENSQKSVLRFEHSLYEELLKKRASLMSDSQNAFETYEYSTSSMDQDSSISSVTPIPESNRVHGQYFDHSSVSPRAALSFFNSREQGEVTVEEISKRIESLRTELKETWISVQKNNPYEPVDLNTCFAGLRLTEGSVLKLRNPNLTYCAKSVTEPLDQIRNTITTTEIKSKRKSNMIREDTRFSSYHVLIPHVFGDASKRVWSSRFRKLEARVARLKFFLEGDNSNSGKTEQLLLNVSDNCPPEAGGDSVDKKQSFEEPCTELNSSQTTCAVVSIDGIIGSIETKIAIEEATNTTISNELSLAGTLKKLHTDLRHITSSDGLEQITACLRLLNRELHYLISKPNPKPAMVPKNIPEGWMLENQIETLYDRVHESQSGQKSLELTLKTWENHNGSDETKIVEVVASVRKVVSNFLAARESIELVKEKIEKVSSLMRSKGLEAERIISVSKKLFEIV